MRSLSRLIRVATGSGTPEAHCPFGDEPDGGFFVIDS